MASNVVQVNILGQNSAGPAIDEVNLQLEGLRTQAQKMAVDMEAAGAKTEFSMTEAKGTIALVGEEIGVHVPRHVRGFIAELPGVGVALEAAFSATAVLVLLDVFVKLVEKAHEWYEALMNDAEAAKIAEAAHDELVNSIMSSHEETAKLTEQFKFLGLTKLDTLNLQLQEARNQAKDTADMVGYLRNQLFMADRDLLDLSPEQVSNNQAAVERLTAQLQAQNQKAQNLQKEYDLQKAADAKAAYDKAQAMLLAAGESKIAAEKTIGDSELDLQIAQAQQALAQTRINETQETRILGQANEDRYQLEVRALQERIDLLKTDPTKNVNALRDLNAKLEAAENEHLAKNLAAYTDMLQKVAEARAALQDPTQNSTGDLAQTAEGQQIDALMKAYDQLGIKGTQTYVAQLNAAQEAYDTIRNSGVASATDILQAQMKVEQAVIAWKQSMGEAWGADQEQLAELQRQYDSMTGVIQRQTTSWKSFASSIDHDFANLFTNLIDGTKTAGQAFANFGLSLISTMNQMIAKMLVVWSIQKLLGWLGGLGGGGGFQPTDINVAPTLGEIGGIPTGFGSFPHFAAGGYMSAGMAGIVGDGGGPELWIPDTPGRVIPMNRASEVLGGGTQQNFFDLRGSSVTPSDISKAMIIAENRAVARASFNSRETNLRRA